MMWINLVGLVLIGIIIWWFWLYKAKTIKVRNGSIEVIVKDGVYQPANISIPANKAVEIAFYRQDPTPCAEALLIPDLDISETLPLNKKVVVSIPATVKGNYPFHCQMQMYKGTLSVE